MLNEELAWELDTLLRYVSQPGKERPEVQEVKQAAMRLATLVNTVDDAFITPEEIDMEWGDGDELIKVSSCGEYGAEDCEACMQLEDRCPFHHGVDTGTAQLLSAMAALQDNPDLLTEVIENGVSQP